MSQSVQGTFSAGVNLTTTFGTGTAGSANEVNNLGTTAVKIGPGQASGQQFADCWSQTYSNVSAPFTIDVTNLTGIGARTANFTSSGVRLIEAFNCDPNVGADFTFGASSSNGLEAPFGNSTTALTVPSGMPAAGVSSNGQPTGNQVFLTNCTPAGWTVNATHKTLTVTPVFSSIMVSLSGGGGGSGAVPGTVTVTAGVITAIGSGPGGSAYASAPTVTISGGGGSGATATATVSGGSITGYVVTNGGSLYNLISNLTLIIAG